MLRRPDRLFLRVTGAAPVERLEQVVEPAAAALRRFDAQTKVIAVAVTQSARAAYPASSTAGSLQSARTW